MESSEGNEETFEPGSGHLLEDQRLRSASRGAYHGRLPKPGLCGDKGPCLRIRGGLTLLGGVSRSTRPGSPGVGSWGSTTGEWTGHVLDAAQEAVKILGPGMVRVVLPVAWARYPRLLRTSSDAVLVPIIVDGNALASTRARASVNHSSTNHRGYDQHGLNSTPHPLLTLERFSEGSLRSRVFAASEIEIAAAVESSGRVPQTSNSIRLVWSAASGGSIEADCPVVVLNRGDAVALLGGGEDAGTAELAVALAAVRDFRCSPHSPRWPQASHRRDSRRWPVVGMLRGRSRCDLSCTAR